MASGNGVPEWQLSALSSIGVGLTRLGFLWLSEESPQQAHPCRSLAISLMSLQEAGLAPHPGAEASSAPVMSPIIDFAHPSVSCGTRVLRYFRGRELGFLCRWDEGNDKPLMSYC